MDTPPPIIVEYASGHEHQILHLWLPQTPSVGEIPIVVTLPGGGWTGPQVLPSLPAAGAEYLSRGFAWAQAGYAYSGMPGPLYPANFPTPEQDARFIVSFFRSGRFPGVGGDFVALDGRSAGTFGCLWAATQPNPPGRITRPNAILVSQLASHYYPALVQNVGSDMAPHLAWPTSQLKNVHVDVQVMASPHTWIDNAADLPPMHITGAQQPTSIEGWASPTSVLGVVPIGHDGWNALALRAQLLAKFPVQAALGAYVDGMPPADSAKHRATWLERRYKQGHL